ncbi:DUF3800 domain-containing protein [Microbacterium sp. PRF11]|uniref:DUF3800 domain-containing protein n=1 Tax=Microbacterium sp. PRF11 TaxID=2962593 RepID=UPI002881D1A4|nr:DUF3800 domain-containing protein [Microbacterium sp. PRF11]MDT0118192.1 DUF3800 domain-containing protein [Microbacterium sp. PRF11]
MLIAYLDEFGHVGPYVSKDDPSHKTHPAFGYAGFVLPVDSVRSFGGFFEYSKENLLRWEIERAGAHPRRWEKKGSSLLTTRNYTNYGKSSIVPVLNRLNRRLRREGGAPVFFGQVKELGLPEATTETPSGRSAHMLINAVRQLASFADRKGERIMIFLDAVDSAPRLHAVQVLGGYIYKAIEPALRRVVEVPMQLESKHYGNVQYADWIAAIVSRASDFHLTPGSEFSWAPSVFKSTIGSTGHCDVGSYVKASHDPKVKHKLHVRDLGADEAWRFRPKPLRPRMEVARERIRPERRRTRTLANRIADVSPELKAFYDTLQRDQP